MGRLDPSKGGGSAILAAEVIPPAGDITRVELHPRSSGVFLYLYGRLGHGPRLGEEWYESRAAAEDACRRRFGIDDRDWTPIG